MDFFTNRQISETSKKLYLRNLKKLNNNVAGIGKLATDCLENFLTNVLKVDMSLVGPKISHPSKCDPCQKVPVLCISLF